MRAKILKYSLMTFAWIVAFFAWRSVDQAINVIDASIWGTPIILFTVFFTLIYLNAVMIKEVWLVQGILLISILLSMFFAPSLGHLVAIIAAYLLMLRALVKIKNDLQLNIRICLRKSIGAGSALVLLAISIIIASQYYCSIKNQDSARLIPQFKINSMTGGLTSKMLVAMNSDYKNLDQEGLTINQFIMQIQENQNQEQASNDMDGQIANMIEKNNPQLTIAQKKILKEEALKKAGSASMELNKKQQELVLQESRKKLSEIAGAELTGDEKVADVLAGTINKKIDQYLGSGLSGTESPLPFIMTFGLFLTILPLGSFLNTFWMLLAQFIFFIFVKFDLARISKIPVEMEVIE